MQTPQDLIKVREAATILGVCTARVYQLIKSGQLPSRRLTLRGPLVIRRSDALKRKDEVVAMLAKRCRRARPNRGGIGVS